MSLIHRVLNPFQRLHLIGNSIRNLKIPVSSYLAAWINHETLNIAELGGKKLAFHENIQKPRNVANMLISWIQQCSIKSNVKFVAAEIVGDKWLHPVISQLWLKEDIIPYFIDKASVNIKRVHKEYVRTITERFLDNDIVKVVLKERNEVDVAELVTLDDYQNIASDEEFDRLLTLVEKFNGKKMVFISATPQGGGVALMRHALIRFYKLLGVDAHWHVLMPMKEVFDITKTKIHNVLQAVSPADVKLTDEDKQIYNTWTAQNAQLLKPSLAKADVVIIDDPQPAGLIPHIKEFNPKAKIVYRSHIQVEAALANKADTRQSITWQFIWDNIKDLDLFVSHPILKFIPEVVPPKKTVLMPATTDALDGLNKPLSPRQTEYYLKLFDRILLEQNQESLDPQRPYIIQVARFDPAKGIPDVIESYRLLREKLKGRDALMPQLVIVGHGSIDDPEGVPLFNLTLEMLRQPNYIHLAADVKVARLPAVDQILNALLREAKIALQLSTREGFEVKVSEALMKGVPVIAYQAGGIPLQIKDGVSGFLVDVGDQKAVADRLYELLTDNNLYYEMRKQAIEEVNTQTTTISNAINWLFLATELVSKGSLQGDVRNIKELLPD